MERIRSYLGMENSEIDTEFMRGTNQGEKIKSIEGWNDHNTESGNGTDELGFSVLPSSYRKHFGLYYDKVGVAARFWSKDCWVRYLHYYSSQIGRYCANASLNQGYSVRCLKDHLR